ncbi:MAG: hypothetical protein WCC00_00990 [Candidatus Aminicenantales bacterium]
MKKLHVSRWPRSPKFIAIALVLLGCGLFGQEQSSDWDTLEMAARTYFNYPSTENARLFYLGLQKPLRANMDRSNKLFDFVFKNLYVLARQIHEGDRNAVKLGFWLYNYSSGLYTMELDAMMADSIRSHPQLFLEELKASPNAQQIKRLGYPLCESRINSSDDQGAEHRYELEMRIKALESVTNDELVDLRDICLREIRNCLDRQYHDFPGILLEGKEYLALFEKAVVNVCQEAEMAYQICQGVIEIEEASDASPFGATSQKAVRSSGLVDELTALSDRSLDLGKALESPPLSYVEEYDTLRRIIGRASQLSNLATDPSIISPSGTSDDVKKSSYKRGTAKYYNEFKKAYAELEALMPEISQEVQNNMVDLEAIKRRLSQRR